MRPYAQSVMQKCISISLISLLLVNSSFLGVKLALILIFSQFDESESDFCVLTAWNVSCPPSLQQERNRTEATFSHHCVWVVTKIGSSNGGFPCWDRAGWNTFNSYQQSTAFRCYDNRGLAFTQHGRPESRAAAENW